MIEFMTGKADLKAKFNVTVSLNKSLLAVELVESFQFNKKKNLTCILPSICFNAWPK